MQVAVDSGPFLASWRRLFTRMADDGFESFWRATKGAKEAMHEYGYQNKTGRLTDSMRFEASRRGPFSWRGQITIRAPYALFVDQPTRWHWIFPRGESYPLRFYWHKIGAWVAFWHVKHPGTKGAGFAEHARQWFNVKAPAQIQSSVDAAIQVSR